MALLLRANGKSNFTCCLMFENTGHAPVFLFAGFQVALIRIFTSR
jgi:hypothetical protein